MNVLYIITGLGLGGAEKVVVGLAEQMHLLGHKVKIAYLKGEALVIPNFIDIECVYLKFDDLSSFFSASKRYRSLIHDFNPDVVHAHMVHANIFARLNRIGCNVPKLICTAHNSNEGGKLRMLAYKLTNYLSDINTNVSNEASESLIVKGAFSKQNLITVYNGIDLEKFNKIEKNANNKIKFLSVGRFNEQKDYPNLLNAIALLKDNLTENIKFYIAGDGELRNTIESLIIELEITNFVELLGKRSDIPELLNEANFFILPSKHEGLPTVVIEAMACQTYVISTNCGGSAEIMGSTGKLIPAQDSIALSEAINNVLVLGDAAIEKNNLDARKRVEDRFSLKVSVNKWLELYEK